MIIFCILFCTLLNKMPECAYQLYFKKDISIFLNNLNDFQTIKFSDLSVVIVNIFLIYCFSI